MIHGYGGIPWVWRYCRAKGHSRRPERRDQLLPSGTVVVTELTLGSSTSKRAVVDRNCGVFSSFGMFSLRHADADADALGDTGTSAVVRILIDRLIDIGQALPCLALAFFSLCLPIASRCSSSSSLALGPLCSLSRLFPVARCLLLIACSRYVQVPIYSWFDTMVGWVNQRDTLTSDCPAQMDIT